MRRTPYVLLVVAACSAPGKPSRRPTPAPSASARKACPSAAVESGETEVTTTSTLFPGQAVVVEIGEDCHTTIHSRAQCRAPSGEVVTGSDLRGVGCDGASHVVVLVDGRIAKLRTIVEPLPSCGAGHTWASGRCVTSRACKPDERQVDDRCLPHIVCPGGSHAHGDACTAEPSCPPGLELKAGRCLGAPPVGELTPAAHEARLEDGPAAPFFIDRTEVSVEAFSRCVAAGACAVDLYPPIEDHARPEYNLAACNLPPGRKRHPMNCVSPRQARAYCAWAGARLPTERQWQTAAASPAQQYPWGDDAGKVCAHAVENPCAEGSCADQPGVSDAPGCGRGTTSPVGSQPSGKSREGVLNLAGNVSEWVMGKESVIRGGSWRSVASTRAHAGGAQHEVDDTVGFRCARSARGCPPPTVWDGTGCSIEASCPAEAMLIEGACVFVGQRLVLTAGSPPPFYIETRPRTTTATWLEAAHICADHSTGERSAKLPSLAQYELAGLVDDAPEWVAARGTASSYQPLSPTPAPGAYALAMGRSSTLLDPFRASQPFRCAVGADTTSSEEAAPRPAWSAAEWDAFCHTSFPAVSPDGARVATCEYGSVTFWDPSGPIATVSRPTEPTDIERRFAELRGWSLMLDYDLAFDPATATPHLPARGGFRATMSYGNEAVGEGLRVTLRKSVITIDDRATQRRSTPVRLPLANPPCSLPSASATSVHLHRAWGLRARGVLLVELAYLDQGTSCLHDRVVMASAFKASSP